VANVAKVRGEDKLCWIFPSAATF